MIALIKEHEPAQPLEADGSVLWVRRVPVRARRQFEKRRRAEMTYGANGRPTQESATEYAQQLNDDLLDYAIVKWEKVQGDPPCTREEKVDLAMDVQNAVFRLADSISIDHKAIEAYHAKNGSPPSDSPAS